MADIDDRVRDALAGYAATTSTSSDAWEQTRARAHQRLRRSRVARAATAAIAAAVVAAGVAVAVAHRPGERGTSSVSAVHPSSASFFSIRPVLGQLRPPCPSESPIPGATVLPELHAGTVLACYEVGAPAVDDHDVASARPVVDPNGEWSVEFTLTPAGTAHFNALAASVGQGGQAAIVVDDVVMSAPRLDTTSFPGVGRITGVDERGAQQLASRFRH